MGKPSERQSASETNFYESFINKYKFFAWGSCGICECVRICDEYIN